MNILIIVTKMDSSNDKITKGLKFDDFEVSEITVSHWHVSDVSGWEALFH